MNVRDSEVICGLLKKEDYQFIDNPKDADIVLFNTCSVRQHAEDKVWSEVGRVTKLKGQAPSGTVPIIIGIVGCMAQAHKENIFERAPQVDFIVGPSDIHQIPEIIHKLTRHKSQNKVGLFGLKIWETDGEIRPEEIYHTGFYEDKSHAYVVISEGCSNFCAYCVVPYVRGELRNRSYQDILREIEQAVDKGITNITLLGQNVNAYQYNEINFIRLIKLVNLIKGIKEFSFITSHPKDTSVELFKAMAKTDKLKKYLHLPVQSGSDRILELMNRGYAKKYYLDLVSSYRKIVKGGVLTTDIIVGFPTEKEDDFKETYNLLEKIEPEASYIFKYSPRAHTQAAEMVDDVEKKEKERRHKLILDLQRDISRKKKCPKKIIKIILVIYIVLLVDTGFSLDLDKVKVYYLKGDYKSAILEGEKVLANTGFSAHSDELYYLLGLSYIKDGNYLRASDIFEIIIKEFKDSILKNEAKLGLGDSYFLRGNYKKAKTYYEELLNTNDSVKLKPAVYYRLSQCAFKEGAAQEGKDYADKLRNEFPANLETKFNKELYPVPDFYTIQVGSFSNSNNANNLCSKLISKGYDAYIQEADADGKKIYRVKVGRLKSRAETIMLENKLSSEGYPTKIAP
jgi:tRNA-2-methylthio-N6-dimethylallyladenosine synthase